MLVNFIIVLSMIYEVVELCQYHWYEWTFMIWLWVVIAILYPRFALINMPALDQHLCRKCFYKANQRYECFYKCILSICTFRRGSVKRNGCLIYTLSTLYHFISFYIIFMFKFRDEKCWCILFEGIWQKVCFVLLWKCWHLWTTRI